MHIYGYIFLISQSYNEIIFLNKIFLDACPSVSLVHMPKFSRREGGGESWELGESVKNSMYLPGGRGADFGGHDTFFPSNNFFGGAMPPPPPAFPNNLAEKKKCF